MRTRVWLPEQLLRKAKKRAAETGQTLTSLIKEGLNAVLSEASRRQRRPRVQLPISSASGGTLPGIDLNRSSDLEDRMGGL